MNEVGGQPVAGGALSLREDPFRLTPDRRFIFSTDAFRRAFDGMLGSIRDRRGIVLLTGPSGTGKTTLLQALQEQLQSDGAIIFLRFHANLTGDLITSCLAELGSPEVPVEEPARMRALIELIRIGTRAGGPPAVLIIDEAGQFSDAQLSDLHRLVAPGHPLAEFLQIVLAALPSFEERVKQSQLAPLQQAIVHRARLQPLRADELAGYIAHRCRVAGLADGALFEAAAIPRIYELTRGTPRLVNRLCSAALFVARSSGGEKISVAILEEAALACDLADAPATAKPPPATAPRAQSAAPPATPPRPRTPAAPLAPEASVLAEAERAWVKAVLPPIGEPAAAPPPPPQQARPHAPPAPAVLELTEPAPPVLELSEPAPPVLELSEPAPPVLDLTEPLDERVAVLAARRRLPSLRIAASIALVATSGVALAALYWPSADRKDAAVAEAPAADSKTVAAAAPPAAPAAVDSATPEPSPPVRETEVAAATLATPPTAPAPPGSATPEPTPPAREPEVAAATPAPSTAVPSAAAPSATNTIVAAAPPAAVEVPASTPNSAPAAPAAAMVEAPAPPPPAESAPTPAAMPAQLAQAPEAVKEEPPAEPAAAPTAKVEEPASPPSPQPQVATNVDPPAKQPEDAAAMEPAAGQDPQVAPKSLPAASSEVREPADTTVASNPPAPEIAKSAPSAVSAPAIPPAPVQPVSPPPQIAAIAPEPPVLQLAQTAVVPPTEGASQAELVQLMARGDEMMRIGDPASARLFYERAAARGLARGFTAVGRTYDPVILQQLNIRGGGANGERALDWYRRGAEAGDADAGKVAGDLTAWLARRR